MSFIIAMAGKGGTGKTTAIAKVAHRLKGLKIGSVLAAGDTFRAGAIEQLSLHGDKLGIKVVKHQAGSDPAAVAYDAIEHAKARLRATCRGNATMGDSTSDVNARIR